MGPFDHFDTGFGFYFFDNDLFVGAVIRDARADMDLGDFSFMGAFHKFTWAKRVTMVAPGQSPQFNNPVISASVS